MEYKSNRPAPIDMAQIESNLKTTWLGKGKQPNEFWPTIASTNDRALQIARQGQAAGVIVIASHQSAGRGRSGNAWLSPAGSGLYLSFITDANLTAEHWPVITLVTGIAVVRTIQDLLGLKVGLKWVNDLMLESKKIGGILAEYVPEAALQNTAKLIPEKANGAAGALVIGIGLNLSQPKESLPENLKHKVGYLEPFLHESGEVKIDRNYLVSSLANELENVLTEMHTDLPLLLDQWRAYSVTLGAEIMAKVGNEEITGQAIDITDGGELIVKTIKGNLVLRAGEISIRRPDGSYA